MRIDLNAIAIQAAVSGASVIALGHDLERAADAAALLQLADRVRGNEEE